VSVEHGHFRRPDRSANLINGAGLPPAIVSVSYGECEAINGNGGNAAFYNTFQQAAAEGVSVFGATGDGGPSSCSADLTNGTQTEYNEASLSVSGWTERRSTLPSVERISRTSITPTRGEPP